MEQSPEERKAYLKELNNIAAYTAALLHGDDVSNVRIRQFKKYFNKTYKMLHRLADKKGDINVNSFKYGYGGKILVRKIMLELKIIEQIPNFEGKKIFRLLISKELLSLDLVSQIIVEVYLKRNEVKLL